MKRPFAISLAAACAITGTLAVGCTIEPAEEPPASSPAAQDSNEAVLSDESLDAFANFSIALLQNSTAPDAGAANVAGDDTDIASATPNPEDGETQTSEHVVKSETESNAESPSATVQNRLVSPYSVASALGMTANGAQGETLHQMESLLGMPSDKLNAFMAAYTSTLPAEGNTRMSSANSIWVNDKASVDDAFLDTNTAYYRAGVFATPFDAGAKERINSWVEDNTDGMIDGIVDSVSPDMTMLLANATSFDAKWTSPYEETQVSLGTFTAANGEAQEASMMGSIEHAYLEDEHATGFAKTYGDGDYAFVALLPNEGSTLEEYIASLDGATLRAMIANAENTEVEAYLPKFESEQSIELVRPLANMGMTDAFDAKAADFSRLSADALDQQLHIDGVTHKTFISVAEQGTRAGAATAVSIRTTSAMPDAEPKIVRLDRPFIYAIVDTQNYLPLFLGTVTSL